ncbi:MAG: hypothetical protein AABW50_02730 [Nanoarchaeota archaeon]
MGNDLDYEGKPRIFELDGKKYIVEYSEIFDLVKKRSDRIKFAMRIAEKNQDGVQLVEPAREDILVKLTERIFDKISRNLIN